MKSLQLTGRDTLLFKQDIEDRNLELIRLVQDSKFLVLGGAGSIGQALVKEIFQRKPKKRNYMVLEIPLKK